MLEASILDFKIKDKNHYCLWYSDEGDRFVINNNKLIYYFGVSELIKAYTDSYIIDENIVYCDVDILLITHKEENSLSYNQLMNFWNMMTDLSKSLGIDFFGNKRTKQIDKVYDKLFWGLNLPSVTPIGKEYIPIWETHEKKIMSQVVLDGAGILNDIFRYSEEGQKSRA